LAVSLAQHRLRLTLQRRQLAEDLELDCDIWHVYKLSDATAAAGARQIRSSRANLPAVGRIAVFASDPTIRIPTHER
jgi:hypothetical protein